jgi:hypothetical protein
MSDSPRRRATDAWSVVIGVLLLLAVAGAAAGYTTGVRGIEAGSPGTGYLGFGWRFAGYHMSHGDGVISRAYSLRLGWVEVFVLTRPLPNEFLH